MDPSSYSESENGNLLPGTGGSGLDAPGEDGEGEDGGGAAVTVGDGDNALLVGGGGEGAGKVAEGGAEGADGSATPAADDTNAGVPLPHPMDVEEPEWDVLGDCVPLPAWKARA